MDTVPLHDSVNQTDRREASEHAIARGLPATQARQGIMLGHVRYVLGISLALAVIAFAIIYFLYF